VRPCRRAALGPSARNVGARSRGRYRRATRRDLCRRTNCGDTAWTSERRRDRRLRAEVRPRWQRFWTRQFGTPGNDSFGPRRVIASGRGIFVTGTVASALPGQSSVGGIDVFATQYDGDGAELWTLQFGTSGDEAPLSADVVENDEIYLSGRKSGGLPRLHKGRRPGRIPSEDREVTSRFQEARRAA
jgi:hypothetical protein